MWIYQTAFDATRYPSRASVVSWAQIFPDTMYAGLRLMPVSRLAPSNLLFGRPVLVQMQLPGSSRGPSWPQRAMRLIAIQASDGACTDIDRQYRSASSTIKAAMMLPATVMVLWLSIERSPNMSRDPGSHETIAEQRPVPYL